MELNELDSGLTILLTELENVVGTMNFTSLCEFTIDDISSLEHLDLSYPGVYFLEIKHQGNFDTFADWLVPFEEKWGHEMYKRRFVPNIKNKRIHPHIHNDTAFKSGWVPLYLGKSKNIKQRIMGHINIELHKTTFALKLRARENLKGEIFRLSTIKIDVQNYEWIVPKVERILRDRYNPIAGKQ